MRALTKFSTHMRTRASGLLTQARGPAGGSRRGPRGCSPDRESAIGNAPTLLVAPGLLARLYDLQLLTELSPQSLCLIYPYMRARALRGAEGEAEGAQLRARA